jgi:hypothetical protein
MKTNRFLMVILVLIMAAMACNLPYQNPAVDVPVMEAPADGFRVENRLVGQDYIGIAVPNAYYVGASVEELSALVGGFDFSDASISVDLQGLLSGNQDDILLWGYDASSPAAIPTSFVVIKNTDYAMLPLGVIATFAGPLMGGNVEILEESRLTIAGRDTLRWVTVTREAGLELIQAVYIFKQAGVLYLVGFNTDRQQVYGQLPVFDSIVSSLSIESLE